MPIGWGMAAMAGASLISGGMQANAAKDAANTQAQAGAAAQANVLAAGQQGAQQYLPYQGVGTNAISALNTNMPYLTSQFSNKDLNANLAPNYQFMLNQGEGANAQAANVSGGGSNVNRSNQVFTQNYAKNAYQNAFANYSSNQTNLYNKLSGLTGIGQAGATGAANAMIGTGTNIANITQGVGNAQAAGTIGAANAYSGAATNLANLAYLTNAGNGSGGNVSNAIASANPWSDYNTGGDVIP